MTNKWWKTPPTQEQLLQMNKIVQLADKAGINLTGLSLEDDVDGVALEDWIKFLDLVIDYETTRYAIRISKFLNGVPSGKPDGMFIRKDGGLTDHKPNALLFQTADAAVAFADSWSATTKVDYANSPIFVVKGSIKPILHEIARVEYAISGRITK